MRFSERNGHSPVKVQLQIEAIDNDLRSSLWSALALTVLHDGENAYSDQLIVEFGQYCELNFFKQPVDSLPRSPVKIVNKIRNWFFECSWHGVYDFLELAIEYLSVTERKELREKLESLVSKYLEREKSGYRLVADRIVSITSDIEVAAVNESVSLTGPFEGTAEHIRTALQHYSNRTSPDYRNSVKESICAVEFAARVLAGKHKATLSDALKAIEVRHPLHSALKEGFIKLYGYTSDESGVRHALTDEGSTLDRTDALFMLVICSAFCNYLSHKYNELALPRS
jgi:hypothetical protein